MHAQDDKNADAVVRFYRAIMRGDLAAARKLLHRDFVWVESDGTGILAPGIHAGASTVLTELIAAVYGRIGDFRMEAERFHVNGQHVVVIGRVRGFDKTSQQELNAMTTHVWTWLDGKALRVRAYNDVACLSEALSDIEKIAA